MPDYEVLNRRLRSVLISYLRHDPSAGERTSDIARIFRVPEWVAQAQLEQLLAQGLVRAQEGRWFAC